MNARIGIDFGGVIVRNLHEDTGEDTSLRSTSGSEAARDGAFDAIRQPGDQSFHRRPRACDADPSRGRSPSLSVRRTRGREALSALGDLRNQLARGGGLGDMLPTTQSPALTSRGVPE